MRLDSPGRGEHALGPLSSVLLPGLTSQASLQGHLLWPLPLPQSPLLVPAIQGHREGLAASMSSRCGGGPAGRAGVGRAEQLQSVWKAFGHLMSEGSN